MSTWRRYSLECLAALAVASSLLGTPARADETRLLPQTKIKLTVVQWIPTKGEYEDWQAIGGEFTVSQSGTLQLPVIGSLAVGTLDSTALAAEIATRLQTRMGLVDKPDTTVEILEYPPVYVAGDVVKPGEYRFRTGITVLQALALSGGPLRATSGRSADEIRLVSEIKATDNQILRSKVKMVRLRAEMAGAAQPDFRSIQAGAADSKSVNDIVAQERIIFSARANEIARQSKSLMELRDLLGAEIDALQEKIKAIEVGIKNAQQELASVTVLVEKGLAVASRKSDLERLLASLQADRLDQVTAIMRARQNITQATRDLEGLQDKHQTEVASELQQEQAGLDQLQLREKTSQKLLVDLVSSGIGGTDDADMHLTVIRSGSGGEKEVAAAESTALLPGDVLKVRLDRPVFAGVETSEPTPAAGSGAPQDVSQ